MSGQDERELEEALQRSLKDMGGSGNGNDDSAPMVGTVLNKGAEKEEQKKFQAFTGQGVSLADNDTKADV